MVEMRAKISGDKVVVDNERLANTLNARGYGRLFDEEKLELSPVEAMYLMEKKKLKIFDGKDLEEEEVFDKFSHVDERFGHKFIVYRDLRKRGYRVKCFHDLKNEGVDYRLKPKRPQQRDIFVVCAGEREEFTIDRMVGYIERIDPLIEELWVGVVDEEGEVTYYKIEEIEPKGKFEDVEGLHCRGILLRDLVMVKVKGDEKKIFEQGFYGSLSNGEISISLIEALYLVSRGILDVYRHNRKLGSPELIEISRAYQPDIEIRYQVYKDLRERNVCVKTGYKFGTHFRAYERDPRRYHAEYLIDVVKPDFKSTWPNMSRGIRLAHSVRKVYVLAVVSEKIRYISMERIKP